MATGTVYACKALTLRRKRDGRDLLELDERSDRDFLDSGNSAPGRRAKRDSHGHSFVVVEHKRRQRRPRGKPVAAGHPGRCLDRIAQRTEANHVVADRPRADLQPLRQLGAGPLSARLEKGQNPQQAGGGAQHRYLQVRFYLRNRSFLNSR